MFDKFFEHILSQSFHSLNFDQVEDVSSQTKLDLLRLMLQNRHTMHLKYEQLVNWMKNVCKKEFKKLMFFFPPESTKCNELTVIY